MSTGWLVILSASMAFCALHELFDDIFELLEAAPHELALRWSTPDRTLEARLDLVARTFHLDLDGEVLTVPADFA